MTKAIGNYAVEMQIMEDVIVLFIASLGMTMASVPPPTVKIWTHPPPETIWATS